MATIKKRAVTPTSHAKLTSISDAALKPNMGSIVPGEINPLDRFTMCVRGRIAMAIDCKLDGNVGDVNGKNVPAKNNIGVMKRKDG